MDRSPTAFAPVATIWPMFRTLPLEPIRSMPTAVPPAAVVVAVIVPKLAVSPKNCCCTATTRGPAWLIDTLP